jgi:hypothetical protein
MAARVRNSFIRHLCAAADDLCVLRLKAERFRRSNTREARLVSAMPRRRRASTRRARR